MKERGTHIAILPYKREPLLTVKPDLSFGSNQDNFIWQEYCYSYHVRDLYERYVRSMCYGESIGYPEKFTTIKEFFAKAEEENTSMKYLFMEFEVDRWSRVLAGGKIYFTGTWASQIQKIYETAPRRLDAFTISELNAKVKDRGIYPDPKISQPEEVKKK